MNHGEGTHRTGNHGVGKQVARDPVCGMSVSPESAAGHQEHNGRIYHFCSTHCLEKFRHEAQSKGFELDDASFELAKELDKKTEAEGAVDLGGGRWFVPFTDGTAAIKDNGKWVEKGSIAAIKKKAGVA